MSLATLKRAVGRAAIGDALRAAGGNIARAAKALEIAPASLSRTLRYDPGAWPEGVPRRGSGRPRVAGGGRQATDDELRAAVVAAGTSRGRWSRVGEALGIKPATARSRALALGL